MPPPISLGIEYRVDFPPSPSVPAYLPRLTTSQLIRSITQRSYKEGTEVLGAFCGIALERTTEEVGVFSPRLAGKLPHSCRGGASARSAESLHSVLILPSMCVCM